MPCAVCGGAGPSVGPAVTTRPGPGPARAAAHGEDGRREPAAQPARPESRGRLAVCRRRHRRAGPHRGPAPKAIQGDGVQADRKQRGGWSAPEHAAPPRPSGGETVRPGPRRNSAARQRVRQAAGPSGMAASVTMKRRRRGSSPPAPRTPIRTPDPASLPAANSRTPRIAATDAPLAAAPIPQEKGRRRRRPTPSRCRPTGRCRRRSRQTSWPIPTSAMTATLGRATFDEGCRGRGTSSRAHTAPATTRRGGPPAPGIGPAIAGPAFGPKLPSRRAPPGPKDRVDGAVPAAPQPRAAAGRPPAGPPVDGLELGAGQPLPTARAARCAAGPPSPAARPPRNGRPFPAGHGVRQQWATNDGPAASAGPPQRPARREGPAAQPAASRHEQSAVAEPRRGGRVPPHCPFPPPPIRPQRRRRRAPLRSAPPIAVGGSASAARGRRRRGRPASRRAQAPGRPGGRAGDLRPRSAPPQEPLVGRDRAVRAPPQPVPAPAAPPRGFLSAKWRRAGRVRPAARRDPRRTAPTAGVVCAPPRGPGRRRGAAIPPQAR